MAEEISEEQILDARGGNVGEVFRDTDDEEVAE